MRTEKRPGQTHSKKKRINSALRFSAWRLYSTPVRKSGLACLLIKDVKNSFQRDSNSHPINLMRVKRSVGMIRNSRLCLSNFLPAHCYCQRYDGWARHEFWGKEAVEGQEVVLPFADAIYKTVVYLLQ